MINPFAAGLLSFLIDGSRTMLVAGTRSSGKTSMLGALMQEISKSSRIIVIEDSLELPVES
jgi:type IV secretory pathway ATPase VirB11/archaellum biosynthesis ATPase